MIENELYFPRLKLEFSDTALQEPATDPEEKEVNPNRKAVSEFTGIPENLFTADTIEGCIEQAKAMKAHFAPPEPHYPDVYDGGNAEMRASSGESGNPEYDFAQWLNKAF